MNKKDDDNMYGMRITGQPLSVVGRELNVSNYSASILGQLLKFNPESGHMHPLPLLKRIEQIKANQRYLDFTHDPSDSAHDIPLENNLMSGTGVRVIDFGIDENKILGWLNKLEEICDYCIAHECNISWG